MSLDAVSFPTRSEFEVWLAAKPPRSIAGRRRSVTGCPLAGVLAGTSATVVAVRVDALGWELWRTGQPVTGGNLPDWARQFIRMIDEPREIARITASRARVILREIPA